MADAKTLSKDNLKTSVAGSTKGDSTNLRQAAIKADAKANADAAKVALKEGEVRYGTLGVSNFSVEGITFGASTYITADKEEQKLLDDCVKRQLLKVVEDKRK